MWGKHTVHTLERARVSLQIMTGSKARSSHGKHGVGSTAKCSEAQKRSTRTWGKSSAQSAAHLVPLLTPLVRARDPFLQRKKHRAEARLSGGCRLPVRCGSFAPGCWFLAATSEQDTGVEQDGESKLLTVARALKGLASFWVSMSLIMDRQ